MSTYKSESIGELIARLECFLQGANIVDQSHPGGKRGEWPHDRTDDFIDYTLETPEPACESTPVQVGQSIATETTLPSLHTEQASAHIHSSEINSSRAPQGESLSVPKTKAPITGSQNSRRTKPTRAKRKKRKSTRSMASTNCLLTKQLSGPFFLPFHTFAGGTNAFRLPPSLINSPLRVPASRANLCNANESQYGYFPSLLIPNSAPLSDKAATNPLQPQPALH